MNCYFNFFSVCHIRDYRYVIHPTFEMLSYCMNLPSQMVILKSMFFSFIYFFTLTTLSFPPFPFILIYFCNSKIVSYEWIQQQKAKQGYMRECAMHNWFNLLFISLQNWNNTQKTDTLRQDLLTRKLRFIQLCCFISIITEIV